MRGFVVADSGSSKTDWAFVSLNGDVIKFQSPGLNPKYLDDEKLKNIFKTEVVNNLQGREITHFFFYGAGCNGTESKTKLDAALRYFFPNVPIDVMHDLMGAARACFKSNEGMIGILGTGSNAAFYDGNEVVEQFPSLGYLIGDEGSGCHLGKELVRAYVNKKLDLTLYNAFKTYTGLLPESLIFALYGQSSPNRFLAGLSPFLYLHQKHPLVKKIIKGCFKSYFVEQVYQYNNCENLEIKFVGSIAYHYNELLKECGQELGLNVTEVLRYPIDGMISYHQSAMNSSLLS
jgi:glucosamine kinase